MTNIVNLVDHYRKRGIPVCVKSEPREEKQTLLDRLEDHCFRFVICGVIGMVFGTGSIVVGWFGCLGAYVLFGSGYGGLAAIIALLLVSARVWVKSKNEQTVQKPSQTAQVIRLVHSQDWTLPDRPTAA